ncbi:MAG: 50S ribosomal protein L11 methyltransferase [Acidobacteriota bacterium]|nr:50S ribosomal protein L11 methyltransferase [Blastocatellia bacterium]MDW8239810.1 50S ribosomal protein L11 methyltransferase [Acidobacteriota bacterium]
MDQRRQSWWALRLTILPEVEEVVSAWLWEAGTIGISSEAHGGVLHLSAYFTAQQNVHRIQAGLRCALSQSEASVDSLIALTQHEVAEQDWLESWKKGYHATVVGQRLLIVPSWEANAEAHGRIVIEIDPGMAFGTGTHQTTQLCLIAIERYWRGGRFLDVGTGTGILAMAAAKLYPDACVVGIDTDPLAIEVARANLIRNQLDGKIQLQTGSIETVRGRRFDLIVANLTAEVIEELAVELIGLLAAGGRLILSGILVEQEKAVCCRLARAGIGFAQRCRLDEWIALVTRPFDAHGR